MMFEILKEKYPDLDVRKQTKYLRDKYPYTVEFFHIGNLIWDYIQGRGPSAPRDLLDQEAIKNLLKSGVPIELVKQIYQKIKKPLKQKQISCRFQWQGPMRVYLTNLADTQELIDLVVSLQQKYTSTQVLGEICAVPAGLEPGVLIAGPALRDHQFQVLLRNFQVSKQQNFLNLLANSQSDLKLNWCLCQAVNPDTTGGHRRDWIFNPMFYSKNAEILTFLRLAEPGLIRKIYRLKHQQ